MILLQGTFLPTEDVDDRMFTLPLKEVWGN